MIRALLIRAQRGIPRSRWLARLLFGIRFGPVGPDDYYFDVTTLVLFRRLLRVLPPGSRVLDMGTGSMAVLALALWKHRRCRVVASDVDPVLVELARENVRRNGADVPVLLSRFLDHAPPDVTVVVFNPPYVPTATGLRRGLSGRRRSQWDGGPTGAEVIEEYFAALQASNRRLTTYLGVNRRHLPAELFLALLDRYPRLTLEDRYRHPLLPVDVYAIARDDAGRPAAVVRRPA